MSIIEVILAIFLPPVAVALRFGLGGKFWLNVLLTIIGIIPGVIHAFYVLSKPATAHAY
ncbi:Uncharacterized membrane protein YqaE, homolog of Blt101, UPF0057 family [Catalinimonas alkaloidigena]|uniref:Uncharacterized membrane protein YqaE, homolog of Blt101, UPF0057 family n=1 Tax=Catalinimonas alkaloidigena TaxID=1075417 RepID=A0A1G9PDC2_9BACT|nr:YqaE/Pmp3 family membrane protein [Catalinimonas alkaloidigena]SDL96155.1 Uncharacterized membrane protein YqaE, homolog of Blt101, UPF0057 family [Catalinimonas alkaloidigena]